MKLTKLQKQLQALNNRLNRYISQAVKATKSMIVGLIIKIARLENQIEICHAHSEKQTVDPFEAAMVEHEKIEGQVDDLIGEFANLESISHGSPKQQRWASYIFARACQQYAWEVVGGEMEMDKACQILQNPSAKWWIDNRFEFGYE